MALSNDENSLIVMGGMTSDCSSDGLAHTLDLSNDAEWTSNSPSRFLRRRGAGMAWVDNNSTYGEAMVIGGVADSYSCCELNCLRGHPKKYAHEYHCQPLPLLPTPQRMYFPFLSPLPLLSPPDPFLTLSPAPPWQFLTLALRVTLLARFTWLVANPPVVTWCRWTLSAFGTRPMVGNHKPLRVMCLTDELVPHW